MILKKLLAVSAAVVVMSCGLNEDEARELVNDFTGNEEAEEPSEFGEIGGEYEEASFDQMVNDPVLLGSNIQASTDEASSSFADGDDAFRGNAPSASLALVEGDEEDADKKPKRVLRSRECTEEEGAVSVEIKRAMEHRVKREGPVRKHERAFSFQASITRDWTNDDANLECHENGKHINLEKVDFASNVKLVAEFAREKHQWNKTTFRNGKTRAMESKFKSKGTRTVNWTSYEEGEETITAERTVTLDASRVLEIAGKNGKRIGFESKIMTKEDAPLMQVIERSTDDLKAKKRTIKSGTIINQRKDESRIETTFTDVVYGVEEACMPESGVIAGAVYKKDQEDAVKSYTITFTDGSGVIVFDNGDTTEYVAEGCELEDVELNEEAEVSEEGSESETDDDSSED